jgi:hypothetical protein
MRPTRLPSFGTAHLPSAIFSRALAEEGCLLSASDFLPRTVYSTIQVSYEQRAYQAVCNNDQAANTRKRGAELRGLNAPTTGTFETAPFLTNQPSTQSKASPDPRLPDTPFARIIPHHLTLTGTTRTSIFVTPHRPQTIQPRPQADDTQRFPTLRLLP